MRCKKHPSDLTSSVGVCASCLRESLFALIAYQVQLSSLPPSRTVSGTLDHHRKSDPNPPPLAFPRSVSPYVSRPKSNETTWHDSHHHCQLRHSRFYSTPHVGPTFTATGSGSVGSCKPKKHGRFSLLTSFFRSRSEKFESDPRVSTRHPTSSWLSKIFSGGRKDRQTRRNNNPNESITSRRPRRRADHGMSPDCDCELEEGERSPLGSGYSSESCEGKEKIPTVPPPSERRQRGGNGRNVSAIAFCLSPLVRASPNRHWNQKTLQTEIGYNGEGRFSLNPHISTAASYCGNRSRKLADFGRVIHNR